MLQPKNKHWLNGYQNKTHTYICCLQKTHFKSLKVRGWKKVFHTNKNQKKAGIAILILSKIDFKMKVATRDRERHYIMIMGSSKRKI